MSDSRVIPLAVALSFPGASPAGAVYRSLICDPFGAGWVSLGDPVTGAAVATLEIGSGNVDEGAVALVTASGVFGSTQAQLEIGELRVCDSIAIAASGAITPEVAQLTGLATASVSMLTDGDVFAPARGIEPDGAVIHGDLGIAAFQGSVQLGYGFDATADSWAALAVATAPTLGSQSGLGASITTGPGEWTLTNAPADATAASATRAAGTSGVRHVLTSFSGDLNAVAAQASPITFVIRDGASGVGTILYQRRLIALAGDTRSIELTGLNIIASEDTELTVETIEAPDATNFVTVSASGYSIAALPPPPSPVTSVFEVGHFDVPPFLNLYGYSFATMGVLVSDGIEAPNHLLAVDRNVVDNRLEIVIQGDVTAPDADLFTSFVILDGVTPIIGPLSFAAADDTGTAGGGTDRFWYFTGEGVPLESLDGEELNITFTP